MDKLFAASTSAFYAREIHGDNIPSDAVEITDEEHAYLLKGESSGKVIKADSDGRPFLADKPPPTVEYLAAEAVSERDNLLRQAAIRMGPLQDAVDLKGATDAEVALLLKWKQYRVDLNRIRDQEGFPQKVAWPTTPD